jgi:7-cyano-7-deazaguanine synthase in queuosine biosynthesis
MSTWNIICRTGPGDAYTPSLAAGVPRLHVPIDQPGAPGEVVHGLLTRVREHAGQPVPDVAADLVYLAVAVFAADLRVQRKHGEGRWARDLTLHLPVSDPVAWRRAQRDLLAMLGFLTGDRWQVELRQRAGSGDATSAATAEPPAAVCLFSGGLDSFIGAVDRLEAGGRVVLVSHYGPGVTSRIQRDVFASLRQEYGNRAEHIAFWVHPPLSRRRKGEPTMRSRSLLFLSLGTAVASAYGGMVPLVVPENGYMTLNVPLTGTRLSSLSTRTTHPHFISLYRRVLAHVGLTTPMELPYRFRTKGEMLSGAANPRLVRAVARETMSCAHPEAGRHTGAAPSLHCGYCVPCLIRRASMHAARVPDAPYRVDVRTTPPSHHQESGRDLRAFLMALERMRDTPRRALRFHALDAGPLREGEFGPYADVYVRGLDELAAFLSPQEAAR